MTQRFTTSQWVPFPVEQVFAFFADPANLPRLMPAKLDTKIESARIIAPPAAESDVTSTRHGIAAAIGSEILISFRPVPLVPYRVRWTARIVEFVWNEHFCDEQVRGPFAIFRHCHRLRAEARDGADGTVITDEINFQLPFGWIGRAGAVFVRLNLGASFKQRQDQLLKMLSAARLPSTGR